VFVHDDPWVGTNHASDVCVFAPLFWEGELFAWLYNCAHHRDVGGAVPGSVNPNAVSAYDEPSFFPPTKMVEGGYLREDVMDAWTRRSRLPEIEALELKAQFAGITFARARLIEIVERYGAGAVKRAMNKRIEDSAKIVAERLSRLPDGRWRDEMYLAGAGIDDSRPYKLCLTFEKRGDRLRVSNEGTDPSVGCLNQTVGAFRGSVVSPLFHALGWDLDLCGAGILRQLDFDVVPGKINSATHPASVGSSIATNATLQQGAILAAKMVSGEPQLSTHAVGASAIHTVSVLGIGGTDRRGTAFAGVFLDMLEGGSGAFSNRDGIDHAGATAGIAVPIPDVEDVERALPVLCLYRHELPQSGAHGRFRGGAAVASAFIGHGTGEVMVLMVGLLTGLTLGRGVDGGWPATAGTQRYARESVVREWFARGRIPVSSADIGEVVSGLGNAEKLPRPFTDESVYEMIAQPGAGCGDPLLRDPAAVVEDLRRGRVSHADAERVYGVITRGQPLGLDDDATARRRRELLEQRLADSREPREPHSGAFPGGEDTVRVLASIALAPAHGELGCAHCGQHLAPADGNFRLGCRELEATLPSISSLYDDPETDVGEPIVLRLYLCPACGLALDGDICKPTDTPYPSFQLS
jgi:N-methylhydantoinase B